MSRPDPNGCSHCGEVNCRRPALKAQLDDIGKWSTPEELKARRGVRAAWIAARNLCESRPAVDWQAVARALAAERAASPPQEVVEAARRIGELAKGVSPGRWRVSRQRTCVDTGMLAGNGEVWDGYSIHPHFSVEGDDEDLAQWSRDAAFIAECRTLAPLLAEWIKGGGK